MTQGITTAAKKAGDAAKAEKEEKKQNAPRQQWRLRVTDPSDAPVFVSDKVTNPPPPGPESRFFAQILFVHWWGFEIGVGSRVGQ